MPEDRSLDDFASAGTDDGDAEAEADSAESDSAATAPSEEEADETTSDESIPTDVEPAESTSTWSTDGADCDRCETTVTRRWHADGNLLCSECVEW